MSHKIRQHMINGFGQKVTKVKQVQGELGSGILDKNGKEIFENDVVKTPWDSCLVEFVSGAFYFDGNHLSRGDQLEVIGHKDDFT